MDAESRLHLREDVLEAAGLDALRRRFRVAMHRVRYPQHLSAGIADRADHGGQRRFDATRAEAVDQRQPPGFVVRIQDADELDQLRGFHPVVHLDRDRVGDAAEVLDVRAARRGGPEPDPWHVRRQVVPALPALEVARLRLLVEQVQSLVARVEARLRGLVDGRAGDGGVEVERVRDRVDDPAVGVAELRMLQEAEVPVLRVVHVREAAVDQRAHEIERERGALVAAQEQFRVRLAIGGRERGAVDEVAAVARQGDAVPRFRVGRSRLGELARDAADADHRFLEPVQQHDAHLQEDLELARDGVGVTVGEALRAVASLQQETLAPLRRGELRLELVDFPGHHDRRQARELPEDTREPARVPVNRLLECRQALPAVGRPDPGFDRRIHGSGHRTRIQCTAKMMRPRGGLWHAEWAECATLFQVKFQCIAYSFWAPERSVRWSRACWRTPAATRSGLPTSMPTRRARSPVRTASATSPRTVWTRAIRQPSPATWQNTPATP